jgi:hypothetical protein
LTRDFSISERFRIDGFVSEQAVQSFEYANVDLRGWIENSGVYFHLAGSLFEGQNLDLRGTVEDSVLYFDLFSFTGSADCDENFDLRGCFRD